MIVHLSTNIRYLRNKLSYTQPQFAELLGITTNAVQKYEQGARTPDLEKMLQIKSIYNISLDDLVLKDLTKENK